MAGSHARVPAMVNRLVVWSEASSLIRDMEAIVIAMYSKSDINTALGTLQADLQQFVELHDRRTALTKFSAAAWDLIDSVPDSESSYVFHRIGCMMSGAGLMPGQDDGEQCPIGD